MIPVFGIFGEVKALIWKAIDEICRADKHQMSRGRFFKLSKAEKLSRAGSSKTEKNHDLIRID